jgi:hypothetical protein
MMQFAIIAAVLFAVVYVVSGPLRRDPETESPGDAARDLEAAREAKYREIRDNEMDHRTGKLSDADFEAIDTALRSEAVEILHRLDDTRIA